MFYCPKCKKLDLNLKYNKYKHLSTWVNPRDGFGRMIRHIVCPNCKYVLSGILNPYCDGIKYDKDDIEYDKYIIELYSHFETYGGKEEFEKLISQLIKENKERAKKYNIDL